MVVDVEEDVLGEIIVTPTPQTDYASGMDHVVIRNEDGTVRVLGLNQYGQGAVSDWNLCQVDDWKDIVYVTAGDSCTIGIKADGSMVIAGEIGW